MNKTHYQKQKNVIFNKLSRLASYLIALAIYTDGCACAVWYDDLML